MHPFYSFCFTLGFLLLLPYFLYQGLFHKKYFAGLGQRLGFLPTELTRQAKGGIWVHAVSVGEFLAIVPLLKALKLEWPDKALFVTTTTLTGQKLAHEKLAGIANVFYFPLDWKFAVQRCLRLIRPSLVLIVETEIWPNFLRTCRLAKIPVLLINGRLSDKSIARYRKITWFMRQILKDFQFCLMQTPEDRDRLISLGAPLEKVGVAGNIKYDLHIPENIEKTSDSYRQLFGLGSRHFVVVAGSTMDGEEELVLSAFRQLAETVPASKLILAPRHPERIREVEGIIASFGFAFKKRTDFGPEPGTEVDPAVVLLDTMGELLAIYHLADAVFVGGSLVPRGGHNIMEPALFEKPILFGPYMNNFREIASHFVDRQAALMVPDCTVLADKFIELAQNPPLRKQLGLRAGNILAQNRGATRKVLDQVRDCLMAAHRES
jgi:3-deoxy-D-manno-octulosonic-acid transferase